MMDMYPQYKSRLGYATGDNKIDSYGVDHSGFTTRDELEYQRARTEREQQLIQEYNRRGIANNYPQYGTNFWGNPENNYGFGSSNIHDNIENMQGQPLDVRQNSFNSYSQPYQPAQDNISSTANGGNDALSGSYSDEALKERMSPVIKDMEKPKDFIYIDTTWNKTTGAGANVDDWDTFNNINWEMNGRLATEAEKRAAFDYFDAITTKGKQNVDNEGNLIKKNNNKADFYKDKSQLRLLSGEMEKLLDRHIEQDIKYLRRKFPDFASYPPELQNVLLDIKFNTGNVSKKDWPNLRKAIAERNLFGENGIVYNVHRKDVDLKRNNWAEQQIRNIKSWE